jgi:hypothetical protein
VHQVKRLLAGKDPIRQVTLGERADFKDEGLVTTDWLCLEPYCGSTLQLFDSSERSELAP